MTDLAPMQQLLSIMAKLRDPQGGCAWDLEQNFATIAPYTIEEAYEVAEAIGQNDMVSLKEELGDLLLQVVFHAQMAEEAGYFTFADVAAGIAQKMTDRHPHVFGDAQARDAEMQTSAWEAQKAQERAAKAAQSATPPSALDGVAAALPALMRAQKLGARAARTGFDWPDTEGVIAKIHEELNELQAADNDQHRQEELGDLLFACTNLARHWGLDAEEALRGTNAKFTRRFTHVEARLRAQNIPLPEAGLARMEALWSEAKHREKNEHGAYDE